MKCENCEKELPKHNTSCPYCGWSMVAQKSSKPKSKFPIIIIIVVICIIGILLVYNNATKKSKDVSQDMFDYANDALEYADEFYDGKISSIEASAEIMKIYESCEVDSSFYKDEFVEVDINALSSSIISGTKSDVKENMGKLRNDLR